MLNGTLDCCERHASTVNPVIEAIQKYLDRELKYCDTARDDDEWFNGVRATVLDIQDIINK